MGPAEVPAEARRAAPGVPARPRSWGSAAGLGQGPCAAHGRRRGKAGRLRGGGGGRRREGSPGSHTHGAADTGAAKSGRAGGRRGQRGAGARRAEAPPAAGQRPAGAGSPAPGRGRRCPGSGGGRLPQPPPAPVGAAGSARVTWAGRGEALPVWPGPRDGKWERGAALRPAGTPEPWILAEPRRAAGFSSPSAGWSPRARRQVGAGREGKGRKGKRGGGERDHRPAAGPAPGSPSPR